MSEGERRDFRLERKPERVIPEQKDLKKTESPSKHLTSIGNKRLKTLFSSIVTNGRSGRRGSLVTTEWEEHMGPPPTVRRDLGTQRKNVIGLWDLSTWYFHSSTKKVRNFRSYYLYLFNNDPTRPRLRLHRQDLSSRSDPLQSVLIVFTSSYIDTLLVNPSLSKDTYECHS